MFSKQTLIIFAVILLISGCVSSLYIPKQEDAISSNTSLEILKTGRELYVNKCGSCHNLYLPSLYDFQRWNSVVDKMQKRSKIDDNQKELIIKYLNVCSKK